MTSGKFKILTLGEPTVGRSALIRRYIFDTFSYVYEPNVGEVTDSILYEKILPVNELRVNLEIWDVVAYPRLRDFDISFSYWHGTSGVMLIFDLTNHESFNILKEWRMEVERYCAEDVIKMVIGNKNDKGDAVQVSYAEAKQFCGEWGMEYYETSAVTSFNVEEIFASMATQMLISREKKKKPRK